jgi:hypothetical protein
MFTKIRLFGMSVDYNDMFTQQGFFYFIVYFDMLLYCCVANFKKGL